MENKSEILRETLSKPYWHQKWVKTYVSDSKKIYNLIFDEIKKTIWQTDENNILDAGCGNGVNSLRLVERGFQVTASDFSDEALKLCKVNLTDNGLEDKVELLKEDLLSLTFENNRFQNTLCWGVLMHIYEIEKALNELCRVIKPGGSLVICEVSKNAMDSIIIGIIKNIFNKKSEVKSKTKFGVEYWADTDVGRILVRKTDISALIKHLDSSGFELVKHIPGQFSQLYTKFNSYLVKKIILFFNLFWYKYVGLASPSLEQVLIFKKRI